MALNQIKVTVQEMGGKRCVVVESGMEASRAEFLSRLLQHNGYEVMADTDAQGRIALGVTDLLFNPVIDVYERRLRSFTGHKVTPAYWLQRSDAETVGEVTYWKHGE
ncbi:MAG: hypothetical protein JXR39_08910 [Marinilabiliaceae bacterium]|nr:hypothetical protein [Marinilabiliaceae bacterium]